MTVTLEIPGFEHSLSLLTHKNDELVSDFIRRDKIWEAYETQLVLDHLKPDQTFVDIGANIGYYSLIASKIVGNKGKVTAFEPEPLNFALLESNIELNKLTNVTALNCGLGAEDEEKQLFISDENRGDHRCFDKEKNRNAVPIKIQSGDNIFSEADGPLHFIKVDTQGFEAYIIKGFKKTIKENAKHLTMILEFWPFALKENGTSARQLINELRFFDFKVREIDHINHKLIDTDLDHLLKRAEETDLLPETQGFINILLSPSD